MGTGTRSATIPGGLDLGEVPLFCRAQGAFVYDTAGKPYLDLISGYGTVIAGHANTTIVTAVSKTLQTGNYMYGHHGLIPHLEERLTALFPATTRAFFFKTGSEAVQCATRVSRAVTGRERILRCGFHGWHDQFMTENVGWHDLGRAPVLKGLVSGVPAALATTVTRVAGDELSLGQELSKGDVAAFILDPVQLTPPYRERLHQLREMCRTAGALLIVDESKTGFRVSPSGVQGLIDVYGDITILSKALANGFPLAAVLVSDRVHERSDAAKIMGTYNHELAALAAANATLDVLFEARAWQQLDELGSWLLARVNDGLHDANCRAFAMAGYRWASMPVLTHDAEPFVARERTRRVAQRLLEHGILWLPHHMNFISLAHDRSLLEGFARTLVSVCAEVEHADA